MRAKKCFILGLKFADIYLARKFNIASRSNSNLRKQYVFYAQETLHQKRSIPSIFWKHIFIRTISTLPKWTSPSRTSVVQYSTGSLYCTVLFGLYY